MIGLRRLTPAPTNMAAQTKIALGVFALSVLVTAAFWVALPQSWRSNESTDYLYFYEPVAQRLLLGQGITLPNGAPATRYPPGYPLLLAAVFGLARLLSLPQSAALAGFILLCTGLSSALLFRLASQAFGLHLGFVSALLWMSYPFNLWLTKQPNSEIPFMVFFFASALVMWRCLNATALRWNETLIAGLLAGAAALIRPIAIGLIGVYAGLLLLWPGWNIPKRLLGAAAITTGFLLVALPWETAVYRQIQQVIPLSTGGAPSLWDGLTYAVAGDYQAAGRIPTSARSLMNDLFERSPEAARAGLGGAMRILIEEAAQNPLGAGQLLGLKAARSWYGTESGRLEPINALIQCAYLMAVAWGGLAAWQSGGARRRYLAFVALLALYFWGMTIAALSILRYMTPAMGLLITLIPAGIARFPGVQAALERWAPF
jgi:hypothetical protein